MPIFMFFNSTEDALSLSRIAKDSVTLVFSLRFMTFD